MRFIAISCLFLYAYTVGAFVTAEEQLLLPSPLPKSMLVVTSDAFPIKRYPIYDKVVKISVHSLDAPQQLLADYQRKLAKQEPAKAQQFVERSKQGELVITQEFREAYRGMQLVVQYGISKYPAIIFNNGESVMYGVVDIHEALERYATAAGQKP